MYKHVAGQRKNPRLQRISRNARAGCVQFLRLDRADFSYREYLSRPGGASNGDTESFSPWKILQQPWRAKDGGRHFGRRGHLLLVWSSSCMKWRRSV